MASTSIDTSNATFRKIMGNGMIYTVPPFQRDYSWDKDEWIDLWQDIEGLFVEDGERDHYMGYLVFQTDDSKNFRIIDGQQRLTTISLIILAVVKQLRFLEEALPNPHKQTRADVVMNSYIGFTDTLTLETKSKLVLNRNNDKYYQTYVVNLRNLPLRNTNASERLMKNAFVWFDKQVAERFGQSENSINQLVAFLESLVDSLFFTVITVSDELNAFKVFETLNARGVRLSSTDLLKNYLFSIIDSSTERGTTRDREGELSRLEERWGHIINFLQESKFPDYLRVYWNSKNRIVRKTELFKTIKRNVKCREAAYTLLLELEDSVEIYAALKDSNDSRWSKAEQNCLEKLAMFGVSLPNAMLLSCYRAFFDSDRAVFSKILHAIMVISFRYNIICNKQPNAQEILYNEIAIGIHNGELLSLNPILDRLKTVYPENSIFVSDFQRKEFRTRVSKTRRIIRYILAEIEGRRSGKTPDIDDDSIGIEHILPQNAGAEWESVPDYEQDQLVYRIGNMTLIKTSQNKAAGNKSYEEKMPIYSASGFTITSAIPEHYKIWDASKVNARQKALADIAAEIWKL